MAKSKDRPKRSRRKGKANGSFSPPWQDFLLHSKHGKVRSVELRVELPDGRIHRYLDYDPDFSPPLPAGAVRGDVRKQQFCRNCHEPRYIRIN